MSLSQGPLGSPGLAHRTSPQQTQSTPPGQARGVLSHSEVSESKSVPVRSRQQPCNHRPTGLVLPPHHATGTCLSSRPAMQPRPLRPLGLPKGLSPGCRSATGCVPSSAFHSVPRPAGCPAVQPEPPAAVWKQRRTPSPQPPPRPCGGTGARPSLAAMRREPLSPPVMHTTPDPPHLFPEDQCILTHRREEQKTKTFSNNHHTSQRKSLLANLDASVSEGPPPEAGHRKHGLLLLTLEEKGVSWELAVMAAWTSAQAPHPAKGHSLLSVKSESERMCTI